MTLSQRMIQPHSNSNSIHTSILYVDRLSCRIPTPPFRPKQLNWWLARPQQVSLYHCFQTQAQKVFRWRRAIFRLLAVSWLTPWRAIKVGLLRTHLINSCLASLSMSNQAWWEITLWALVSPQMSTLATLPLKQSMCQSQWSAQTNWLKLCRLCFSGSHWSTMNHWL